MYRAKSNLGPVTAIFIGSNPERWASANELDTNSGSLSACKSSQPQGFLC